MILETIAEATRKRVAAEKEKCSLAEMKEKAMAMNPDTGFPFEQALKKPGMSFICEVKKASPSKGIIAEDFPYLEIAKEYEAAGASAISCLTEPEYFKGDKRYLKKIAETVSIPVLRKDFTVDPYMIYEAKVLGATAVLLICALLPEETLKEYLEDYASPQTRQIGNTLIQKELASIPNEKVRTLVEQHLTSIAQGDRDFRL